LQVCDILLIDSESDIRILKDLQEFYKVPVKFRAFSNLNDAKKSMELKEPDLTFISSRFLMDSGRDVIRQLNTVPVVILCEADNFNSILKEKAGSILFITRPIEIEKITEMIEEAYAFWLHSTRLGLK
jgi:DNA-binding NtrC family response regulator